MNRVVILFTSVFGELSSPWDIEYELAKKNGFDVALLDEIDLKINTDLSDALVIYRGWMISFEDYSVLYDNIIKNGGTPFISKELFRKTNSFSTWYFRLTKYTMKSFFVRDDEKKIDTVYDLFEDNDSFFVKDNLKSLGDGRSIANSPEEALLIYSEIKENRDFKISDNGLCLREVVSLENEQRFFIVNGEILDIGLKYSNHRVKMVKNISKILLESLGIFSCTMDIASDGPKDILVEVGGFQVSDIDKSGDKIVIDSFYKSLLPSITSIIKIGD